MAELLSTGYEWIRELISESIVYMALFDNLNNEIGDRFTISGEDWSISDNDVIITKTILGDQFALPQTIKSCALFDAQTNGNQITAIDNFIEGAVTITNIQDSLTIFHRMEIPKSV